MSDLSHTIVVKPNLFIRAFVWFWDCAGAPLNPCLIFWGTLGMILLWPLRLILGLVALVATALEPLVRRVHLRNLERAESRPVEVRSISYEPKPPSSLSKLLMRLAHSGSLFWYKFQTPLTWAFRVFVAGALIVLFAFGIYGLSTVAWSWTILWVTLEFIGTILGTVIAVAVFFGTVEFFKARSRQRPPKVRKHTFRRIMRSVHDHTCANVVIEGQEPSKPTNVVFD